MMQRCLNPKSNAYRFYSGSGITVAPEWQKFEGFFSSMGERPEGTTLGRACDLANYEPGGAFWQTPEEQALAKMNKRALMRWVAQQEATLDAELQLEAA